MNGARQDARMLEASVAELADRQSYPFRCGGAMVGVGNALHHLRQLPATGDHMTDWHITKALEELSRANDYLNPVQS